jgi:hypothetical protein
MISHDHDKTAGVLWLNTAETYIDIEDGRDTVGNPKKDTHWLSESGVIDAFLFPGPEPNQLFYQYNVHFFHLLRDNRSCETNFCLLVMIVISRYANVTSTICNSISSMSMELQE